MPAPMPGGTLKRRRERSKAPRKFRLHKPQWEDPYPWIPGTEPEKRIFAALRRRNIYFRFQCDAPVEVGAKVLQPIAYVPDFALPEYKVIIDPFSPFHHSQEDQAAKDATKIALFLAAGWEYYHPWAMDNGRFYFNQPPHMIGKWSRGGWTRQVKTLAQYKRDWKKNPNTGYYLPRVHDNRWRAVTHKDAKGNDVITYVGTPDIDEPGSMGADELIAALPLIQQGPRYPLTAKEDKEAKAKLGYLVGRHVGLGSRSVGAANRRRRKPIQLGAKRRR